MPREPETAGLKGRRRAQAILASAATVASLPGVTYVSPLAVLPALCAVVGTIFWTAIVARPDI